MTKSGKILQGFFWNLRKKLLLKLCREFVLAKLAVFARFFEEFGKQAIVFWAVNYINFNSALSETI